MAGGESRGVDKLMVAMGAPHTFGGDRKPVRPTGKVTITLSPTL